MRPFALWPLLAGCYATTSLEPPPPTLGARSMLLIATGADDYRFAWGVDLPADGSAPDFPAFSRPAEIDLHAVNFACSLEVLGLKQGRQVLLAEESDRLELPAPSEILASHDGANQTGWQADELTVIEPMLKKIELPENNLCRLYGVSFGPLKDNFLAGTSTPTALVPLENGNALVANADGTFYEIDAARNQRKLNQLPPETPNGAGFLAADGSVWLIDEDGTIAHGDPNVGMTIMQTTGATVAALAIVDGAKSGSVEIFRAGFGRIWERFDGVAWTRLIDGVSQRNPEFGGFSTVWLAPNEALATGVIEAQASAIRYKDGRFEQLSMPDSEIPTLVTRLDGIGPIFGTRNGLIVREQDGELVLDTRSKIDGQVRIIVPTKRGFLYGRNSWASWDAVAGYCPIDTPPRGDFPRAVPLEGGAILLIGGLLISSYLSTFELVELEDPCLGK